MMCELVQHETLGAVFMCDCRENECICGEAGVYLCDYIVDQAAYKARPTGDEDTGLCSAPMCDECRRRILSPNGQTFDLCPAHRVLVIGPTFGHRVPLGVLSGGTAEPCERPPLAAMPKPRPRRARRPRPEPFVPRIVR